jgi:hypothetical protein
MEIPYKKPDGTKAAVADPSALKALVESGEIGPSTPLYDLLGGTWCPASRHPLARSLFAPPHQANPTGDGSARARAGTAPDRPGMLQYADLAAGGLLLAEILLLLVAPRSALANSPVVLAAGVLMALGSLLAIFVWAALEIRVRGRADVAPALLGALALGAFLTLGILVVWTHRGAFAARGASPAASSGSAQVSDVRVGPSAHEASAVASDPVEREEIRRIVNQYDQGMEKIDADFLQSYRKENPWGVFSGANARNPASLKAARDAMMRASDLTEGYIKSMEGLYEIVDLRVNKSALASEKKTKVTRAFQDERDRVLPELHRYFDALRKEYSEADEMLAYVEGLEVTRLDIRGPFQGDDKEATLRQHQARLIEAAQELKEVEATVRKRLKESAQMLLQKLDVAD